MASFGKGTHIPTALQQEIAALQQNPLLAGDGSTAGAGLTTSTQGTYEVPLATSAHAWLIPSTKGTNANGYYTATLADLMAALLKTSYDGGAQGRKVVAQIQQDLVNIGQLKGHYTPGIANKGTLDAFKAVALAAAGGDSAGMPVPLLKILTAGAGAGALLQENTALSSAIQSGTTAAMGTSVVTQSLDDPNYIKQQFGAAMESMGMMPTPAQSDQFVQAFLYGPQGQLAARQNQVNTAKQDAWAGVNKLKAERQQLDSGALTPGAAAAQAAQPGPTFVATKSEPNLDAEAMAAAKSIDPAQYYATGASYLGGLLNQMIQGAQTFQTRSEAPSASAPAGGIVSTPMAGAP